MSQWDLMPFQHLQELPALKWRLQNLTKLKKTNPGKFHAQHDELAARMADKSFRRRR